MPKAGIHPTYHPEATIQCSCGATYKMGSTKDSLKVDICKECHPFYSGTQKLIDTAGRVDRFRERMAKANRPETTKAAPVETQEAPVAAESSEETSEEALDDAREEGKE